MFRAALAVYIIIICSTFGVRFYIPACLEGVPCKESREVKNCACFQRQQQQISDSLRFSFCILESLVFQMLSKRH